MANGGISGSGVPCHAVIEESWQVMPATPIVLNVGYTDYTVDPGGDFIDSEESDGKRTQSEPVPGNPKNTMSIGVEFNSANIAFWLKFGMGIGVDTDDDPSAGLNRHLINTSEDPCAMPTLTMEFWDTPCGDSITRYRLIGVGCNQFSWQASGGNGFFKAKFDCFYAYSTNPSTNITDIAGATVNDMVTPSATVKKLDHTMIANARILFNGVAKAYSFLNDITWTHMNNLTPDYGYGDQGNISSMLANKAETKITGTLTPKTAADLAVFNDPTVVYTLSLKYNFNAGGTKYADWQIGAMKFPKRIPGVSNIKQMVKMPFTSTVYRNASGIQAQVDIVNDQNADFYSLL